MATVGGMTVQKITEKDEKLGSAEKERKERIQIKDNDDGAVLEGTLQNGKKHFRSFCSLFWKRDR